MLLLRTDALPDDRRWDYQLKLDGYRAVAFRTGGTVHLRSRNDKDFSVRYPGGSASVGDAAERDGHRR
jgi:ATP-dependent DNA ligase